MDSKRKKLSAGLIIGAASFIEIKKKSRKRKLWSREIFLDRDSINSLRDLSEELAIEGSPNSMIMSKENFEKLFSLVEGHIRARNTLMREAISARIRLLITLRYLATGCTHADLSERFRVSGPSISILIPKALNAICKVLSKKYFKECKTKDDWKHVAQDFQNKWNFPMCLGAVDGRHLALSTRRIPPKSHLPYYLNYKLFNSLIMISVVDADCKFVGGMVDVKSRGATDSYTAVKNVIFGPANSNFPEDEELPGTNDKVPYVFLSADDYSCSRILSPYKSDGISEENKIFNYRLSRAKSPSEKAFSMLTNRFQILQADINVSLDRVESLVLTCCALHNFLITENQGDIDALGREEVQLAELEKSPANIENSSGIRDMFCNYFNEVDVLPWQQNAINKFNF